MNAASLTDLWANCVNRLKDSVNNRSFWEAIELTQPITLENNTLIVGMQSEHFNRAGHIQQAANYNQVIKTVQEVFKKPLQIRLIEGLTLADWDALQERERRVEQMKHHQAANPATGSTSSDGWENIMEQIARLYSSMPLRSLPQGKARYANDALYTLVEAMDALYPDDPEENTERSLARILDRIAANSEIPAPMLAFELERLRAWRKSQ